jgi:hypothetical protein
MHFMRYRILWRALYIQHPIVTAEVVYIYSLLRGPKTSYTYIYLHIYILLLQTLKQPPMHFMRYRILWRALYIQLPIVTAEGVYIYRLLRGPKTSYSYIYIFNFYKRLSNLLCTSCGIGTYGGLYIYPAPYRQ